MLKLFIVSILVDGLTQRKLEAKLTYEEAFLVVKKFVLECWIEEEDGPKPTLEKITKRQVDKRISKWDKDSLGCSYEIWENNLDLRPNLVLVNNGIDYDLTLFAKEEDASKTYREKIIKHWEDVVGDKCPVDSPELLTAEMMEEFTQDAGNGSDILEVQQYELEIQ